MPVHLLPTVVVFQSGEVLLGYHGDLRYRSYPLVDVSESLTDILFLLYAAEHRIYLFLEAGESVRGLRMSVGLDLLTAERIQQRAGQQDYGYECDAYPHRLPPHVIGVIEERHSADEYRCEHAEDITDPGTE